MRVRACVRACVCDCFEAVCLCRSLGWVVAAALLAAAAAAQAPVLLWLSNPTLPGQTCLVNGAFLAPDCVVTLTALGNASASFSAPLLPNQVCDSAPRCCARVRTATSAQCTCWCGRDNRAGVCVWRVVARS
jgi:hypothetical protein